MPETDAPEAPDPESLSITPLCFVLMPFGKKKDGAGVEIDFDAIYHDGIKPGIEAAGLEPLRADAERGGGVIHTAMFERLLLSEFAVADLTTANANVFYELGVRHATRRNTTLPIFADSHLPFDLNYARALPYELGPNNAFGKAQAKALREAVAARLRELVELQRSEANTDSPLFQVLDGYRAPELSHLKTDTFRDRIRYSENARRALEEARKTREVGAIAEIEESLGELDESEAGILVDILLSYRGFSDWQRMVKLIERMPEVLKRTQMIQEQYGLALNRVGQRNQATRVLEAVLEKHGKNPETCGILGRVYKDQWKDAQAQGEKRRARGLLLRAIAMYVEGFEADWRDAYPGVNAATLLDIEGSDESLAQRDELVPVVRYSVTQRFKRADTAKANYWDRATLLELAVLGGDERDADQQLDACLALAKEDWELGTTADNLALVSATRTERGAATPWLDELVEELRRRAGELAVAAHPADEA